MDSGHSFHHWQAISAILKLPRLWKSIVTPVTGCTGSLSPRAMAKITAAPMWKELWINLWISDVDKWRALGEKSAPERIRDNFAAGSDSGRSLAPSSIADVHSIRRQPPRIPRSSSSALSGRLEGTTVRLLGNRIAARSSGICARIAEPWGRDRHADRTKRITGKPGNLESYALVYEVRAESRGTCRDSLRADSFSSPNFKRLASRRRADFFTGHLDAFLAFKRRRRKWQAGSQWPVA